MSGWFADVNCATLRSDAAASALFGHKKGAFTGAADKRDGWLKSADKGVLFLDEIGELGLDEQAMLLKAIEEKRFYPLGSETEESRFQLIADTNRDLRAEVQAGRALFQVSRRKHATPNDGDRLRKYLARFGLRWQDIYVKS